MMAGFDESGTLDAAILLMSLGEEKAAEVFKHLSPKEVQSLGETIARTQYTTKDHVNQVLERFHALAAEQSTLVHDTNAYVRERAAARARRGQGQHADRPHPAGQRRHRHREPEVDGRGVGGRAAAQRASRRSSRRSWSTSNATRPPRSC